MTGSFDSLGREKSASSPATTPGAAAGLVPVSDGAGGFTWTTLSASGAASDLATQAELDNTTSIWRNVNHWSQQGLAIAAAQAAGVYPLGLMSNAAQAINVWSANHSMYLDADDAEFALSGKTPQLRLVGDCHVNAVAPARSLTLSLRPVTAFAGASGAQRNLSTLGAAVTGSTITFTTPAADSDTHSVTAGFSFPADGWHVLVCEILAGATAANSLINVRAQLQVRWI